MKELFVLGGTKPGYHKRYMRAIHTLSKIFDVVYYQYADYGDNISFDLPENVVSLPVGLDRNRMKGFHRIEFEKEVLSLFKRYGKGGNVYLLDFLRFYPLYPFKHSKKIIFETFEYYPGGLLYSIPVYVLGKLKEWVYVPIYLRMLELSDGVIATAVRDIFPANRSWKKFYKKTFFIPNLASIKIPPLPVEERRRSICFGATRKMSFRLLEDVINIWERHDFVFDLYGKVINDIKVSGKQYGFLPYEEYMMSIRKCYAFIVTTVLPGYCPNINGLWTLPNKLFDALGAGTPVLVHKSNIAMAQFVERYQVGMVYDTFTEKEYVEFTNNYEVYLDNIRRYQDYFVWNREKEISYRRFVERVFR